MCPPARRVYTHLKYANTWVSAVLLTRVVPPPLPPHLRPSQPPKSVTIGKDQFWFKSWQFCTPEGVSYFKVHTYLKITKNVSFGSLILGSNWIKRLCGFIQKWLRICLFTNKPCAKLPCLNCIIFHWWVHYSVIVCTAYLSLIFRPSITHKVS